MAIITENVDYTNLLFPMNLTSSEKGFIFLSITIDPVVCREKGHNHLLPMNDLCVEWGFGTYPSSYFLDMDIKFSEVKIISQSQVHREISHKPPQPQFCIHQPLPLKFSSLRICVNVFLEVSQGRTRLKKNEHVLQTELSDKITALSVNHLDFLNILVMSQFQMKPSDKVT